MVGIIDLLMGIVAWRGWSILRESLQRMHLSEQDLGKVARDEDSPDHERPSTRFMVTRDSLGIVAFRAGSAKKAKTGEKFVPSNRLVLPGAGNAHRWAFTCKVMRSF